MATVTTYDTAEGKMVGEHRSGVRTEYLTDVLGSEVGTRNAGGIVVNTYRYKPYGTQLAKTGSGSDPNCQALGLIDDPSGIGR